MKKMFFVCAAVLMAMPSFARNYECNSTGIRSATGFTNTASLRRDAKNWQIGFSLEGDVARFPDFDGNWIEAKVAEKDGKKQINYQFGSKQTQGSFLVKAKAIFDEATNELVVTETTKKTGYKPSRMSVGYICK